ncbi:MAG: glycogen/starch/alpha-glucan phosphorylase [Proteobacteria bacterium]|jgi:starch phosphorylase|nr:glycogen/starch/alpha-glucan phosphorylase [Desulfocapsa sp.]MBU3943472.1 glycogen/starch/alpha-glucan phosphorylase [Pseudomonadota bacterium]MCG2743484.1 glycogen/starch/alpha-glucan phosphorylase [Desulfobacteraceae bacterium]MDO8947837.1 glycogen/starch/alpha-glucan phosphorylase [Desulfocapsaceae bacterium]MBU3982127.1 glycogen/starch/alpha-glucan phosphorylase [Pseudomonadota bacterium]
MNALENDKGLHPLFDCDCSSLFFPTTAEEIKKNILHHVMSFQGRDPLRAGESDIYKALAYTLRDIMVEKWIATQKASYAQGKKRVYYLSLEFLIGRSLGNSMINLGIYDAVQQAVEELGFDMDLLREEEEDAALGNGGLGRLAACFMDSIATLKIPAYGYGILYEYGLFNQQLIDGYQVESPDSWMRYGTPWVFQRDMPVFPVNFYGRVSSYLDANGNYRAQWLETEEVMALPCDILVPGYQNDHVINMRLWAARASRDLDLSFFGRGDYIGAVQHKVSSETISKVLYPPDHNLAGQELRLKQQYFFVAATLQDVMRRYKKKYSDFTMFSDIIAVQLNDTHPAIAIPELMRLLLDIEGLSWEKAWDVSTKTFAYTNHTLMPEALEKWHVGLLEEVLPRHLEIIYEINRHFLELVALAYPGDIGRLRAMSIIEEGEEKKVCMAHLAIVGSHSVNGVAKLHTRLLKEKVFKAFHQFFPGKFNSKTNGITPRRWLLKANPRLADLLINKIGPGWITDLKQLRGLEPWADDMEFLGEWQAIKRANKERLAALIHKECGIEVNLDSMFDIQVKRIHEYKRQLLNCLHVITLYHKILRRPDLDLAPRTVVFAGKAAPTYWKAKLIIKLINSIAEVVNNDPRVGVRLRVVFLPNYNVSQAEVIMPAADLSEQISTAGTEASGTGNMKFSLNGALTIGTLDGANIEILEEVGSENIFIFGMTAEEAEFEKLNVSRTPMAIYRNNEKIAQTIDSIRDGSFSRGDKDLFRPLVDSLLDQHDPYLLLLDFESYLACQDRVNTAFLDTVAWSRMSVLNVARMGKFSTDRTIKQYAKEIWGVPVDEE